MKPARILAPLLVLSAACLPMAASAQSASQLREIADLTDRVEKLEGSRAIMKLQRAFGYYVDRGLWRDAADLFTDNGSIEIGIDGVYVGRARIEEYLRRLHGGQEGLIYGQLNEWVTLQPAIAVADDGQSATGRWRDIGMLGQYKQHAEWRDGIYENAYVKEGGVWKISALHLFVNFEVEFKKGWARLKEGEGLKASAASAEFPADRGPTAEYAPFPQVNLPPFQQDNPVTGKPVKGAK